VKTARFAHVLAAALVAAAVASAAHSPSRPALEFARLSTSSNWSGYAVSSDGATFTDVKGRWTQPSVTCVPGQSYSSFWIGLGGAFPQSQGLEQTGTEGDCSLPRPTYSAWYELIPAPPVRLPLAVSAGDVISAQVTQNEDATATLTVRDETAGTSSVVQVPVPSPDYTSAEWIAEAPSQCSPFARNLCRVQPLANFGTVAFSAATATANGHEGPIADPAWSADPVTLQATSGELAAEPSELASDGGSFNVTWHATGGPTKLAITGFSTAPALPRAGKKFSASLSMTSTDPPALANAVVLCKASVAGARLHVLSHAVVAGAARCTWLLPASSHGRAVTGSITAVADSSSVLRLFKLKIS
jgi:Peptidase A4 family